MADNTFYTRNEAKEILEKCSAILNYICQHKSNVTRYIIEQHKDFKPSLLFYAKKYKNEQIKNLYEAVESEEECMKESDKRASASVLIQATYRMYREKSRWKSLKRGVVALQRLSRMKKQKKELEEFRRKEEIRFYDELDLVKERRQELEKQFKSLSKIHPNRINSFLGIYEIHISKALSYYFSISLECERETAARKIQGWWQRHRPRLISDEELEAGRRLRAVLVLQASLRRWLVTRQQSPAWSSVVCQPRLISEERARRLRSGQSGDNIL